jgi:hypothetical protein
MIVGKGTSAVKLTECTWSLEAGVLIRYLRIKTQVLERVRLVIVADGATPSQEAGVEASEGFCCRANCAVPSLFYSAVLRSSAPQHALD